MCCMKLKISKETFKKYLKIIIVLLVIASISVGLYFILQAFGLTDVNMLKTQIQKTEGWAIVVYILLRVVATIFLSFMPACSMAFDLLALATFNNLPPFLIFLICLASIVLTSITLDLIGRFGGNKAIIKIIGKKEYDEAKDLIQEKGMVYVPVMYLLPIFPDDAICMVSGATKMKFWVHLIEIVLCRGIGCATIIFGVQIIPNEVSSFTSANIMDYLQVGVIMVAYTFLLIYLARLVDKYLTKKIKQKKTANK